MGRDKEEGSSEHASKRRNRRGKGRSERRKELAAIYASSQSERVAEEGKKKGVVATASSRLAAGANINIGSNKNPNRNYEQNIATSM